MESKPPATIMDNQPFVNIMPFGLCTSLANPITAAQTTAALGVLTPGTCTPVIPAPWVPGSPTVLIAQQAGAHQDVEVLLRLRRRDHDRRSRCHDRTGPLTHSRWTTTLRAANRSDFVTVRADYAPGAPGVLLSVTAARVLGLREHRWS